MKNSSFFLLISSLTLCLAFLLALIYKTAENAENIKSIKEKPDFPPACYEESEASYILKEYDGALAVFSPKEKEPLRLLNIYPNTLPKSDREKLSLGISAKSYEELLSLIEDYGG